MAKSVSYSRIDRFANEIIKSGGFADFTLKQEGKFEFFVIIFYVFIVIKFRKMSNM